MSIEESVKKFHKKTIILNKPFKELLPKVVKLMDKIDIDLREKMNKIKFELNDWFDAIKQPFQLYELCINELNSELSKLDFELVGLAYKSIFKGYQKSLYMFLRIMNEDYQKRAKEKHRLEQMSEELNHVTGRDSSNRSDPQYLNKNTVNKDKSQRGAGNLQKDSSRSLVENDDEEENARKQIDHLLKDKEEVLKGISYSGATKQLNHFLREMKYQLNAGSDHVEVEEFGKRGSVVVRKANEPMVKLEKGIQYDELLFPSSKDEMEGLRKRIKEQEAEIKNIRHSNAEFDVRCRQGDILYKRLERDFNELRIFAEDCEIAKDKMEENLRMKMDELKKAQREIQSQGNTIDKKKIKILTLKTRIKSLENLTIEPSHEYTRKRDPPEMPPSPNIKQKYSNSKLNEELHNILKERDSFITKVPKSFINNDEELVFYKTQYDVLTDYLETLVEQKENFNKKIQELQKEIEIKDFLISNQKSLQNSNSGNEIIDGTPNNRKRMGKQKSVAKKVGSTSPRKSTFISGSARNNSSKNLIELKNKIELLDQAVQTENSFSANSNGNKISPRVQITLSPRKLSSKENSFVYPDQDQDYASPKNLLKKKNYFKAKIQQKSNGKVEDIVLTTNVTDNPDKSYSNKHQNNPQKDISKSNKVSVNESISSNKSVNQNYNANSKISVEKNDKIRILDNSSPTIIPKENLVKKLNNIVTHDKDKLASTRNQNPMNSNPTNISKNTKSIQNPQNSSNQSKFSRNNLALEETQDTRVINEEPSKLFPLYDKSQDISETEIISKIKSSKKIISENPNLNSNVNSLQIVKTESSEEIYITKEKVGQLLKRPSVFYNEIPEKVKKNPNEFVNLMKEYGFKRENDSNSLVQLPTIHEFRDFFANLSETHLKCGGICNHLLKFYEQLQNFQRGPQREILKLHRRDVHKLPQIKRQMNI